MKLAIIAPVTKPTAALAGKPSRSRSHSLATHSAPAAAGDITSRPAFWSHIEVSQSAASAAGSVPPITQPKNRPDGIATSPGPAPANQLLDDLSGCAHPPQAAAP